MYCAFHNRLRLKSPFPRDDRRAPPDEDEVVFEECSQYLGDEPDYVVAGRPPPPSD
jgi:hypothetical protein